MTYDLCAHAHAHASDDERAGRGYITKFLRKINGRVQQEKVSLPKFAEELAVLGINGHTTNVNYIGRATSAWIAAVTIELLALLQPATADCRAAIMHPPALMLETILLVTLGVTAAQNNGS